MPIEIVIGGASHPQGPGDKAIVHICNDIGAWGKGFVVALSRRWKRPEREYRRWHANRGTERFQLGDVQFVPVADELRVANLIGQRHIKPLHGVPPIRYDAVDAGLTRVAEFALEHGASIHMPRIGCGLAGGTWGQIEPLITRRLSSHNLQVVVYDLP